MTCGFQSPHIYVGARLLLNSRPCPLGAPRNDETALSPLHACSCKEEKFQGRSITGDCSTWTYGQKRPLISGLYQTADQEAFTIESQAV